MKKGQRQRSEMFRKTDLASRFLLLIVGFLGTCSIAITTYGFNSVREINQLILKTSERIQEIELRVVSIESSRFTYMDGVTISGRIADLDKKLSNVELMVNQLSEQLKSK